VGTRVVSFADAFADAVDADASLGEPCRSSGKGVPRPTSTSATSLQATRELAALQQRMLQMQQERESEKDAHRQALENAESALKHATAAAEHTHSAAPPPCEPAAAAQAAILSTVAQNKDNELKELRAQLAAAQQKLAAAIAPAPTAAGAHVAQPADSAAGGKFAQKSARS